jgi:phenylacetate-coenzyme A ligase PaaK-like adenylate-forming protein
MPTGGRREDTYSTALDLPKRFRTVDVRPETLAPLVAASQDPTPDGPALATELRERLIDLTVRTAARQSPFYERRLDGLDVSDKGPFIGSAALQALPLLERRELVEAGSLIRSRVAKYGFSTYTSGTTTGIPLIVDRSKQEQAYLIRFFQNLRPRRVGGRRLVLSLAGFFHGKQLQIPSHTMSIPVVLSGETGCRQAIALLQRTFDVDGSERRITALSGGVVDAQLLSAFIEVEGLSEVIEPVTTVKLTSYVLTRATARRLSELWRCPVLDRYSISEMFLGASQCGDCGLHHFDPYGVPELVRRDGSPVPDTGRGRLVLTSFYPFSQMTPFLRYVPGDVAERAETGCDRGEGYRLLGRESRSAFIGEGADEILIGESEVLDALDPLPEVRRPRLLGVPPRLADVAGPPLFEWSTSKGSLRLTVPVCFPPWFHRERADSIAASVRRRLVAASPPAQRLDRENRLTVLPTFADDDGRTEALGLGDMLAPGF